MNSQQEILRGYQAKRLRRNDFLSQTASATLLLIILMAVGALKSVPGLVAVATLLIMSFLRYRQGMLHDAARLESLQAQHLPDTAQPDGAQPAEVPRGDAAAEIVEKLPDPFILLDQDGRILASNRLTHPVIGHAHMGRHISSVLRAPTVLEAVELVREGQGPQSVEFSLLVPVERHLHAYVASIRLGPERNPSILLVLHDQTALRRAEQMRVDFVANASHELRTPLASLSGFIETLQGPAKKDPEAQERFLAIMHDQASRMRRLIEDLLSLSRIELNEHVPPDQVIDLKIVLDDVVSGLIPQAEQRKMTIETDIPDDLPLVIAERDEIHQVLQNLLDNAIKYGAQSTAITVRAGRDQAGHQVSENDEAFVHVSIRDRGQGIPREHIPRLTERFYRVDVKRSREQGGTGLGLAIVKHILNRHRGWLTIDSAPNEGSTFTVYIPAAPAGSDAKTAQKASVNLFEEVVSTKD